MSDHRELRAPPKLCGGCRGTPLRRRERTSPWRRLAISGDGEAKPAMEQPAVMPERLRHVAVPGGEREH